MKHAPELINHPLFTGGGSNDAPVTRGIDNLTTEDGPRLELMSRVNSPETVQAVAIGNIYTNIYGSKYVKQRIDQLLRLGVATNGGGRREIIDVVDAGGTLPGEYYTGQRKTYRILGSARGDNEE